MASSFKVNVQPGVLVWARRSAGYRPDEVAKKCGVDVARVHAWEAGDDQPTIAQLRRLGEIYRRPLAVFLLAEPPQDGQAMKDFRRASEEGELSTALRFAIRDAHDRRDVAVDLLDGTRDELGSFDVAAALDEDREAVAARIRDALGVSLAEQRQLGTPHAALARWRAAVEDRGVPVFAFSGVEVREARGFSISHRPLPVVSLNNKDAPAGRVFTLMHELTHLALRTGEALCDLSDQEAASAETEQFCNHVAGAVLVPEGELRADPRVARARPSSTWSEAEVKDLARRFQVSREVVLRRLLVLEKTNAAHYRAWRKLLRAEYDTYAKKLAEAEGGPSHFAKMVSQLGRLYARLVLEAHEREAITSSAASSYLGVKVNHFAAIEAEVMGGA